MSHAEGEIEEQQQPPKEMAGTTQPASIKPPEHVDGQQAPSNPTPHSDGATEPEGGKNRWMIGLTAAIAVSAIVQAVLFGYQLTEMRQNTKIALAAVKLAEQSANIAGDSARDIRDNFRIDVRPYVIAESVVFLERPTAGKKVAVDLTWRNTGRTPAVNLRSITAFEVLTREPEENYSNAEEICLETGYPTVLGAGLGAPMISEKKTILTKQQVEGIENGTLTLYFHGVCTYESIFDQTTFDATHFRCYYSPNPIENKFAAVTTKSGNKIR